MVANLVTALMTAALLAVPPAEPAAGPVAMIPFRWTPGQIEIEVGVNGQAPLWFILDSAAEYSILDEPLAHQLGLASEPRFGRQFVQGISLRLGNIELAHQEVMVMPLDNFRQQGRTIVGVLGYDLFRRYVVAIDYAARTLALHEPRTYRPAASAASIPITPSGRLVTVPVTISMPDSTTFGAKVTLDTGAAQTLILRHPFAESHGLPERAASNPTVRAGSLETTAITFGKLPVRQVTIGRFSFQDPVLRLYLSASGAGGDTSTDGALGNELLRRFTATFDYSRGRLYLQPNASIRDPF